MSRLLVIRFGSLGDLCVLGWSLARLADLAGGPAPTVTLVTKAAWAPLAARFRGVDGVVSLEGSGLGPVGRLATALRGAEHETVIDAHNILRSHLLLGLMGRRPDVRLAKDTAARLAFIRFGRRDRCLDRSMRDRFDDLFREWVPSATDGPPAPPLQHLAPRPDTPGPLGLAPGAQWDTKRWPDNRFLELLEERLKDPNEQIRLFLGPREAAWFDGSGLGRAAVASNRVEVIRDRTLVEVAALLGGCRTLVTNDSGLLHLAEAAGTPVLALFGPTVREFGYFPQLPVSRVLEKDLDCRPCSRNGKRPCHRGDLACLEGITVAAVLETLSAMEATP